jgi:hypothetical protein
MGRLIWLLFIFLLLPLTSQGRVDPNTNRVRTLYVGDAWTTPRIRETLGWIGIEPKFEIQVVPADLQFMLQTEALRYTRLYLPRRYRDLSLGFDIIILHNISPLVMERKVLNFFQRGIEEEGIGAALIVFYFWGGTNDMEVWTKIPFYDALPCDIPLGKESWGYQGKIFIDVIQTEPILDLPGIEKHPMQGRGNHGADIIPRSGSVTHAIWQGKKTPFLVTGSYGRGATLQLATGWHILPNNNYPYLPDFIYNQLYFVADVPPPEDIALARHARDLFIRVRTRKLITISSIEFADKFGANLIKVEEDLGNLETYYDQAEDFYLEGDLASAATTLEEILENFPRIEAEVARLKNEALIWIHITEWLAVVSTSLICGTMVWVLMIRRKVFKEVSITRLRTR